MNSKLTPTILSTVGRLSQVTTPATVIPSRTLDYENLHQFVSVTSLYAIPVCETGRNRYEVVPVGWTIDNDELVFLLNNDTVPLGFILRFEQRDDNGGVIRSLNFKQVTRMLNGDSGMGPLIRALDNGHLPLQMVFDSEGELLHVARVPVAELITLERGHDGVVLTQHTQEDKPVSPGKVFVKVIRPLYEEFLKGWPGPNECLTQDKLISRELYTFLLENAPRIGVPSSIIYPFTEVGRDAEIVLAPSAPGPVWEVDRKRLYLCITKNALAALELLRGWLGVVDRVVAEVDQRVIGVSGSVSGDAQVCDIKEIKEIEGLFDWLSKVPTEEVVITLTIDIYGIVREIAANLAKDVQS